MVDLDLTRLQNLLAAMPIIVWTVDRAGVFQSLRGRYGDQVIPPVVVGQAVEDFFPDSPEVANYHRRAFAGESLEAIVTYGDRIYHCWYSPLKNDAGEIVGVSGAALDITGQRRADESLRQSEAVKRQIIDAVPAGIVQVERSGQVRLANKIAQDFLGLSYQQLTDRYVYDWDPETIHEDGRPFPAHEYPVSRCLVTQVAQPPVTIGVRRPDGQIRWGIFRAEPLRDPGKEEISGVLVTFVDITARKKAEEAKTLLEVQLAQAQKLEAVGRLAGGIAHDFNNLLTGILGHASLILERSAGGTDLHSAARVIELAAERAAGLTRQLLGFARKGKYQSVPVDLRAAVMETIQLLDRTLDKRIRLTTDLKDIPAVVLGDPAQLQQVVLNLALNARDAMPEGGRMIFSIDHVRIDDNYCRTYADARRGNYWRLSVADDGTGMSPDVRIHIFEPFFTTKPDGRGSGMGLPMSYGIVKNHGGWFEVDTAVGAGTTMRVFLPEHQPVEAAASPPQVAPAAIRAAKILLVDDDDLVRQSAGMQLSAAGHLVEVAADGQQALEMYRADPSRWDLVILDLTMPRLDGAGCFAELKKIDPDVRVILSTGYGHTEIVQRCLAEGLRVFLKKPYRPAELIEAVRIALE